MLPVLLIMGIVAVAAYATYLTPVGPWYIALYPYSGSNAYAVATHYADAVTATSDRINAVTVYVADAQKAHQLEHSGAYLFDPQGIELCSKK